MNRLVILLVLLPFSATAMDFRPYGVTPYSDGANGQVVRKPQAAPQPTETAPVIQPRSNRSYDRQRSMDAVMGTTTTSPGHRDATTPARRDRISGTTTR